MSRAQGINTNFNIVLGLMVANGLVALSGALLAQYQGFADINMGRGAIVIGLAAVIIGEAVVSRISQNFAVRLCGVIIGGVIKMVPLTGVTLPFISYGPSSVVTIFGMLGLVSGAHARPSSLSHERYVQPYRGN